MFCKVCNSPISDNANFCSFCGERVPRTEPTHTEESIYMIDQSLCLNCGLCATECPIEAITTDLNSEGNFEINQEMCIGCGTCEDSCFNEAIIKISSIYEYLEKVSAI